MFSSPSLAWRVAPVALCLLVAAAPATQPFEIVVLTDTEYVVDTQAWWPIFPAQSQWIVDNRVQENIVFVSHVGDSPHNPLQVPAQWDRVTDAMYRLDGLVPYAISPGNHDLEDKPGFAQRFGPAHLGSYDWFGGATADGLNSWQTFSAGGYEFLHIALAKAPSTSTLTWARNVIAANPGKPTILTTHDYLDGAGRTSAGRAIWDGLVKDCPQVFMTLNGHDRTYGFRMVSTNSEGKKVLQMLQNYQDYPGPGPAAPDGSIKNSGYMRKIIFDPDAGKVSVQTFSPTFTAQPVLTGDAHQFSYDVAFLPQLAGGSVSPIFVTDAATCPAIGHAQPFDASPGPGGTSLPLGWTAMQIAGDAGTFSSARPIGPADVAAAAAGNQTLLTVSAAPTGPWTGQLANIPGARSTGQAIGSNPGGNAASVIQLKVTNGTGEQTNFIHLYYELARPWASLDDDGTELPGFSLFWSVTGGAAAGDWQTLGADTSPGYRAWDIVLPVPLDPGADLYLRWADDNALTAGGEAAAENVWSLDDVRVVMSVSADPSVRGDADGDGDVDEADYLALKAHLGHTDATWQEGDFNHDGIAGSEDLSLLEHNFGGLGLSSPPAPTPEPASLAMLAAGALGILLRRRPGR